MPKVPVLELVGREAVLTVLGTWYSCLILPGSLGCGPWWLRKDHWRDAALLSPESLVWRQVGDSGHSSSAHDTVAFEKAAERGKLCSLSLTSSLCRRPSIGDFMTFKRLCTEKETAA